MQHGVCATAYRRRHVIVLPAVYSLGKEWQLKREAAPPYPALFEHVGQSAA